MLIIILRFNIKNLMDLIFIDGGHNYSCIKNDTEKAFKMIYKILTLNYIT